MYVLNSGYPRRLRQHLDLANADADTGPGDFAGARTSVQLVGRRQMDEDLAGIAGFVDGILNPERGNPQNTNTRNRGTQPWWPNMRPPWEDDPNSQNEENFHLGDLGFVANPNQTNERGLMPREGWIPRGNRMGFQEVFSDGGEFGLPIGLQGFSTLGLDRNTNYHFPAPYRALTITVVGCDSVPIPPPTSVLSTNVK